MPRIPRMDVYDRILRGTNDSGIKITKDISFQVVVEIVGTSACRESANRTTRATLELVPK